MLCAGDETADRNSRPVEMYLLLRCLPMFVGNHNEDNKVASVAFHVSLPFSRQGVDLSADDLSLATKVAPSTGTYSRDMGLLG